MCGSWGWRAHVSCSYPHASLQENTPFAMLSTSLCFHFCSMFLRQLCDGCALRSVWKNLTSKRKTLAFLYRKASSTASTFQQWRWLSTSLCVTNHEAFNSFAILVAESTSVCVRECSQGLSISLFTSSSIVWCMLVPFQTLVVLRPRCITIGVDLADIFRKRL